MGSTSGWPVRNSFLFDWCRSGIRLKKSEKKMSNKPEKTNISTLIAEAAKHQQRKHGGMGGSDKGDKQPFLLSEKELEDTDRYFNSSSSVNTWIDLLGAVPESDQIIEKTTMASDQPVLAATSECALTKVVA